MVYQQTENNMIHYGKEPSGDLEIRVSADDVGEIYSLLESACLLQRRTFNGLKEYISKNYANELAQYRRRMDAQQSKELINKE